MIVNNKKQSKPKPRPAPTPAPKPRSTPQPSALQSLVARYNNRATAYKTGVRNYMARKAVK